MDDQRRARRPITGALSSLSLFPAEFSPPLEHSPTPESPTHLLYSSTHPLPLLLPYIIAAWPSLLKRLGQRRQVLESILRAGHPLRLTDSTLTIAFPLDRQFHRELLDIPDYRICAEQELAHIFRTKLTLVTCLHPENRELWHSKASRRFEQTPARTRPDKQKPSARDR